MEYELIASTEYQQWFAGLRDSKVRKLVTNRLFRLQAGHFGDCKPVGNGVHEMRFFYGAGYRIYYAREGECLIVLLVGGDKSSQQHNIEKAKKIWEIWHEN